MKKRKRSKKSKEKIESEEVLKRFMANMKFATKLRIAQEDKKKDLEK